MRWIVHGEREIYDSEWVRLTLVDVEVPGGQRFEHHVVRMPNFAAGTVVHDPDRGLLLIHRHRFITDTWGWEIPAGGIDPGETPEEAAARETLEETGWRPGPLTPLAHLPAHERALRPAVPPVPRRRGDARGRPPTDPGEAERIEWVPLDEVRALIQAGRDGRRPVAHRGALRACNSLCPEPAIPDGITRFAAAFAGARGRLRDCPTHAVHRIPPAHRLARVPRQPPRGRPGRLHAVPRP